MGPVMPPAQGEADGQQQVRGATSRDLCAADDLGGSGTRDALRQIIDDHVDHHGVQRS